MQKFTDPVGNEICLPQLSQNSSKIFDDVEDLSAVIVNPAMVIITENNKLLYHYRLVESGDTILLKSEWDKRYWFVTECIRNPDSNLFRELLVAGKVIFSLLHH